MPCALTEIDPPTEKMSVDCIALTAKRGCTACWIACHVAPPPTVTVRAASSRRIACIPRMSSTTPPARNACPPIECFTPAAETGRRCARA